MNVSHFGLKTFVERILCEIREVMDFATLHPAREVRKLAVQTTVEYIERNMPSALALYTARQVLELSLQQLIDGYFLEFGVYRGGTLRFIASRVPNKTLHGFDSFEGLPAQWSGFSAPRGMFSTGGKPPRIPRNVVLHVGLFDATLPQWLKTFSGPISFIHVDCDLYSSTRTIFQLLADRIQMGTIIVFDEYFGYPQWKNNEFKAFQEFIVENNVEYEYLAYAKWQVAVRILKIRASS